MRFFASHPSTHSVLMNVTCGGLKTAEESPEEFDLIRVRLIILSDPT